MIDIDLDWGADLAVGPTGDLAVVSDTAAITQRLCRRLLTNSGDYIWNLLYGGSLGLFVGQPANQGGAEAVIRSQVVLETAIPQTPAPTVSVTLADQANGVVVASISYTDPVSQSPVSFTVNASSGAAP